MPTEVPLELPPPVATPAAPSPPVSSPATATPVATSSVQLRFTNNNWNLAIADADRYRGSPVVLTGRIFLSPQVGETRTFFQMYPLNRGTEGNTGVYVLNAFSVRDEDFVRVEGTVGGMLEGENSFGATLRIPTINASTVTRISREEAVAPAFRTVQVEQSQSQGGLLISLDRIEFAREETRVYATLRNTTGVNASAYRHQASLQLGSRQYPSRSISGTGYADIPSDILPGSQVSAVLLFDAINPEGAIRFVWDGPRTDNRRITYNAYTWNISLAQ